MALKFYTIVVKGLKLKVGKILGLIPTFVEVLGQKLVGGIFASKFWKGLKNKPIHIKKSIFSKYVLNNGKVGKYTFLDFTDISS